jgi:chorismate mutase / prephenate dehydratase
MTPTLKARPQAADHSDSLAALRGEIDALDGQMLSLLQRRLELAREIGRAKPAAAEGEPGSAFRPDREQAVVGRLLERAPPALRPVVLGIWREIMGAGLAAQGELNVVVWTGQGGRIGLDAARRRFGASASYAQVYSAQEALDAAEQRRAVAILALQADAPWWTELAETRPDLWVCEGLAARAGGEPEALAVARVPPSTLARGLTLRIGAAGGDADWTRAPMRTLAVDGAARLQASDAEEAAAIDVSARERGVIGRIPRGI